MRDTRNPFKLRRAENIDTDTTFLSLFEPGILDVIAESGLPETVQLIRSAAGGGKTSLLRLFTPSVLRRLYMRRFEDQDLYSRLQALKVIDERGPRLLGVTLLCGRNYAGLEDLRLDPAVRTRLFLGLLNARIVLAVLRSALALRDLDYPADLGRLRILRPPDDAQQGPVEVDYPCSGTVLYDWARTVEKTICNALDSFGPMRVSSLPGLDSLFSLSILQAHNLVIDETPVADRMLIMMDDIHMLTSGQRALLVERVVEAHSKTGIWIAERFEALSTEELLASGSTKGRDRHDPIELEWYWRGRHERFEKHVMRIADRRVRASVETELDAFRSCLEDSIDTAEYSSIFEQAVAAIRERISQRGQLVVQFRDWIAAREQLPGTPRERAIGWRALEILIERRLRRPQKGLFDEDADAAIPSQELAKEADSSVRNAAEMFLAREFKLPYYFGAERISRLASLNIEQFLGLSGGIFEEVIAAELIRSGSTVISARRQHALMKKAAESFWSDIPSKVRHGREVRSFLESVGRFAEWYTYRATAPNDPGVGGTAIRMSERQALMSKDTLRKRPDRQRFADLLASALAHNYVVADLDYSCKGDTWMVLNLNRLLCVYFNLPLGYGLYKERPLDELCRWVDEPFIVPKQEELPS
jgi:hypothetical protein